MLVRSREHTRLWEAQSTFSHFRDMIPLRNSDLFWIKRPFISIQLEHEAAVHLLGG